DQALLGDHPLQPRHHPIRIRQSGGDGLLFGERRKNNWYRLELLTVHARLPTSCRIFPYPIPIVRSLHALGEVSRNYFILVGREPDKEPCENDRRACIFK